MCNLHTNWNKKKPSELILTASVHYTYGSRPLLEHAQLQTNNMRLKLLLCYDTNIAGVTTIDRHRMCKCMHSAMLPLAQSLATAASTCLFYVLLGTHRTHCLWQVSHCADYVLQLPFNKLHHLSVRYQTKQQLSRQHLQISCLRQHQNTKYLVVALNGRRSSYKPSYCMILRIS